MHDTPTENIDVTLTDDRRPEIARVVSNAISLSSIYNGSEQSYESLFDVLIAFEAYAKELVTGTNSVPEREEQLAYAATKKRVSVDSLIMTASQIFDRRLAGGNLDITHIPLDMVFLPPDDLAGPPHEGSEEHWIGMQEEPQTQSVIKLLNRSTPPIFTDDIIIYQSTVGPRQMRKIPYNLIQIPRLNREILVCDQVGEACYVGRELKGPLFWATYRKPDLQARPDVQRIVRSQHFEDELAKALFQDNAIQPKILIKTGSPNFPITSDTILTKALEHAAAHNGMLPTFTSGDVVGMPGENWSRWSQCIKRQSRGFEIPGLSGLGNLYRLFGLKIGLAANPVMIAKAQANISAYGHHGLVQVAEQPLTSDFVLQKALEYAAAHDGLLPTNDSGEVSGMPGQTWSTWSAAIASQARGFDVSDLTGLMDLFNLFRLKVSQKEDPEVVRRAIENLALIGHHGLQQQPRQYLTVDFVLREAVEQAAVSNGRLPRQRDDVISMPGQTWSAWQRAITKRRRGFDLAGIASLVDLYNQFGLMIGQIENPDIIGKALKNITDTGQTGLQKIQQQPLTADFILRKALEHAAAHAGKLPTQKSGPVIGMPGQKWNLWELAMREQTRGFDIAGITGITDLCNHFGLKIGKSENSVTVSEAIAKLAATGHHGLQPKRHPPLTSDVVLAKALEHAAAHDGKLPTQYSGEVIGLPGQQWSNWNAAILNENRGFEISGLSGLLALFHLFGLKIGLCENLDAIRKAQENIAATGQHGLERQDEVRLTADFVLQKVIEHAAAYDGHLPRLKDEVIGLPGQIWGTWAACMRIQSRGFDLSGINGLYEFYNRFGLKIEKGLNHERIAKAVKSFAETGHHGLEAQPAFKLTADFILLKALEHAEVHGGALPVPSDGEVIGMPGQTWQAWQIAMFRKKRGFDLPNIPTLGSFFNLFGLKRGLITMTHAVAEAQQRVRETGHHGLCPTEEKQSITADVILRKALEYADTHGGKLPAQRTGDVTDMPSHTWMRWQNDIRIQTNGFDIAGLRGLGDLYNLFGLKNGRAVNGDVIQEALNNLKETGQHGLTADSSRATRPMPRGDDGFRKARRLIS